MQQCKDHKENDENLRLYNWPKLRSFEAFVTVIEISIFGFENSTLDLYIGGNFKIIFTIT